MNKILHLKFQILLRGVFFWPPSDSATNLTGENILYEYIRHRLTVDVFVVCFLPEIKGGSRLGILLEEGYDIQPGDVGFSLTRSDEKRSPQWLMMSLGHRDETPIAVL